MNPVPVIDAMNAATQASKNPYIAAFFIMAIFVSVLIFLVWKSMSWNSRNEKGLDDLTARVNDIVTGKNATKNEAVTIAKNGYQDKSISEALEMARGALKLAIENTAKIEKLDSRSGRIERELSAITKRIDTYQLENKKDSSSMGADIKLLLQMVSNIDTPVNSRSKKSDKKST